MVNSHRKTYPWQPHYYCAVPQVCLVCQRKWSNYHCHCIVSLVSQPERHSTRWVHLSISQYITVYHSIPQYITVYSPPGYSGYKPPSGESSCPLSLSSACGGGGRASECHGVSATGWTGSHHSGIQILR